MTIRVRLALAYGSAIVITTTLVGAIVWWQLGAALRSSLDQTLQTRAAAALTGVENNGRGGLQEGDASSPPGVFVVVLDGRGSVIDATPGVPAGFVAPPVGPPIADVNVGPARFATFSVAGDGGIRAIAGSSVAGITETVQDVGRSLMVGGGLAAVVSLAGGWWLAGRALRPVALLTAEASQISAADLDRRLAAPSRHDEIGSLAATLNAMLARVSDAVRKQATFVAAASHDLRTPIAALQAELELAEDDATTEAELRTAIRAARADAARLGELAAGLLDLAAAEINGRALARSAVRTDLLVESVVRRLEPVARAHRASVVASAPGRLVRVDRVRLEQALANLLGNAIKYGPAGGSVEVTARVDNVPDGRSTRAPTHLTIDVLDRGPGVPPELADRLFEPFHRGPNAVGPGSGLGLAVAAAALHAHHGTLAFEPRAGGGTRFWMRLPV